MTDKAPDLSPISDLERALAARVEALTKERDEWKADSAAKGQVLSSGVVVNSEEYADMCARLGAMERENGRLRSMIRVNAMRDHGMSHAEINAAIVAALATDQKGVE